MYRGYNARVIGAGDYYDVTSELEPDGFDRGEVCGLLSRARMEILKLEGVASQEAFMLARMIEEVGGEASVGRGDGRDRPVILAGSSEVYQNLCSRLGSKDGCLMAMAGEIAETLKDFHKRQFTLRLGTHIWELGERTRIMGILNVTPDSFSDGGLYSEPQTAVERALKMAEDGADIIDVGGESSRPGSEPVSAEEEWDRVGPVLRRLLSQLKVPISIDTYKPEVAEKALDLGVHLVNDISGLRGDGRMREIVARYKVPVVVMHMKGTPKTMQLNPHYDSLISEVMRHLRESISLALQAGMRKDALIVDPGIGFGKTPSHNLTILRRLREFSSLGCPIMVGTSRKSFIGSVLNLPIEDRVEGTAATVAAAVLGGAHIVRVHDVREMVRVCRMADAIKAAGGSF
jgi:dihydropteroate synthase